MTRFILRCVLAGLLLGACALNIMVSWDRAEENRDALYASRMGHAEFRWWLAEIIDDCSVLVFQRKAESAQEAMARLPDSDGCLIFAPGIQSAMSEGYAVVIPIRLRNTTFRGGYFKQYVGN